MSNPIPHEIAYITWKDLRLMALKPKCHDILVKMIEQSAAPRAAQILYRRLGLLCFDPPWMLQEIADELGVSRECIRIIQLNALRKLKREGKGWDALLKAYRA